MPRGWVLLVGRSEVPTDGVRDYCRFLAQQLSQLGVPTAVVELAWERHGWWKALQACARTIAEQSPEWTLLQYTPMAWSRRGFPVRVLLVAGWLRWQGQRLAVVYHDWTSYYGTRWVDRLRRAVHLFVLRALLHIAHRGIVPTFPEQVFWAKGSTRKLVFVPIGANLPDALCLPAPPEEPAERLTICVYSVTSGPPGAAEAALLVDLVRQVSDLGPLRVAVFGRGADTVRSLLETALSDLPVELDLPRGILRVEEVAQQLQRATVALFLRGRLEPQRGSALAPIACGTPLIAFGTAATASLLAEAGVLLVPEGDRRAFLHQLRQVLTDPDLRRRLRQRNRQAFLAYFRWEAIAQRLLNALAPADGPPPTTRDGLL